MQIFLFITSVIAIKILPYYKEFESPLNLTELPHVVNSYNEILQTDISKESVIFVESTNTTIVKESNKFNEISYKDSMILVEEIRKPLGKCVTNHSDNIATYKQGWTIEIDFGVSFRLDAGNILAEFGPSFKTNYVVGKGISGNVLCDVPPGQTLQFVIMYQYYEISGVRQREVKIKRRLKFLRWRTIDRFFQVNSKSVQIACITNPEILDC
ncbi:unnamed protein product [Candida verbasci]|uniref:Uncharacterized protein n=1 Tax=Candida verbasci TaxID=1227364 RepID=A0A9W4TRR2_9ASCO|nr:unnamed protein product [Candida verbasci]